MPTVNPLPANFHPKWYQKVHFWYQKKPKMRFFRPKTACFEPKMQKKTGPFAIHKPLN